MTNLLPTVAADGFCDRAKRQVGRSAAQVRIDAGPDMRVYGRLWRKAMLRVWSGHVAQAGIAALQCRGSHNVFADEPVGLLDGLIFFPLTEHRAETVRQALIQAAGVVRVVKLKTVLGHAMGQLVADDVVGI